MSAIGCGQCDLVIHGRPRLDGTGKRAIFFAVLKSKSKFRLL
jgi:hypothetical protein